MTLVEHDQGDAAEMPEDRLDPADVAAFLRSIAAAAADRAAAGLPPEPFAAGTFAAYPMPNGGIMFVTAVADGPMAGERRTPIKPGMVRAALLFASGDRMGAVKALMRGGRG